MSRKVYKNYETYLKTTGNYKKRRAERERSFAHSNGYRYTTEEKEMILKHEIPDVEIAKKIGRTTRSIHTARSKWKEQL